MEEKIDYAETITRLGTLKNGSEKVDGYTSYIMNVFTAVGGKEAPKTFTGEEVRVIADESQKKKIDENISRKKNDQPVFFDLTTRTVAVGENLEARTLLITAEPISPPTTKEHCQGIHSGTGIVIDVVKPLKKRWANGNDYAIEVNVAFPFYNTWKSKTAKKIVFIGSQSDLEADQKDGLFDTGSVIKIDAVFEYWGSEPLDDSVVSSPGSNFNCKRFFKPLLSKEDANNFAKLYKSVRLGLDLPAEVVTEMETGEEYSKKCFTSRAERELFPAVIGKRLHNIRLIQGNSIADCLK